jgi:cardiolipin synthase
MARYLRRDSGVQVRSRHNVWFSSNHAKLVVVDGATAFVGGMNLGREYRYDWRDMMVEVHGPLVHELERQFARAWTRTRFLSDFFLLAEDSAEPGTNCTPDQPRFHILETTPFRHEIYKAQLFAARNASHHIYVENPYMWNTKFIYSLCEARHRGVDVRVTASMSVDFETVSGATRVALNTLIRHGVRVFLYPGMTHVKAAVYDGWACFGSANFDDLSLHKNIELNLCTDDPGFVRQIETQLLLDGQDQSKEIKEPLPTSFWDELSRRVADFL